MRFRFAQISQFVNLEKLENFEGDYGAISGGLTVIKGVAGDAEVVRLGRYVTFLLAEGAVPRELFRKILSLIDDLRRRPVPA